MAEDDNNNSGHPKGNRTFLNDGERNILVVTRGHPFERDAFFGMIDSLGFAWTHIEHPAAQDFLISGSAEKYDSILFYDMPGINFETTPPKPSFYEPSEGFKEGFIKLLEKGIGCVFLHHSIASWPLWEEYGNIVGGRFLYQPGEVRGEEYSDSGYRHDVEYVASPVGNHPIIKDINPFEVTDELYLSHVFESDVTPFLESNYSFTRENFYSAAQALEGKLYSNEGWSHIDTSNVIGWTKKYGNSPIVYIQCGDGPSAYENKNIRKLIQQSLEWTFDHKC